MGDQVGLSREGYNSILMSVTGWLRLERATSETDE
jgi:hypothetical protein